MVSKIDRVMCGTCIYWCGNRELLEKDRKVVLLDEMGRCECPISSKSRELRKKDLKCKEYSKWIEAFHS